MGETLDASPARHLRMLLARAQNPFDVSDAVLERLAGAVLCEIDMHAGRGRGELPGEAEPATARCGRGRHTFLLADGGVQTLWELWHLGPDGPGEPGAPGAGAGESAGQGAAADAGSDGPRFEIYECEEALRRSERRAHGGGPVPAQQASGPEGEDFPPYPPDLARLLLDEVTRSRPWSRDGSPEHARRLLRRAENPDRPGDETLRLLSGACGHDIVHVPRPRACPPGERLWCSLYEHAFLLADGSEVHLYELEHNLTGGEGLVCEVYPDEAVADRAARRHARARGIEL